MLSRQKHVSSLTFPQRSHTLGNVHLSHKIMIWSFAISSVPTWSCNISNCFKYFPATNRWSLSFSFKPSHSKTPFSPLEVLHDWHARTRLSAESSPPLLRGIRWSVVKSEVERQNTHSLGISCFRSHSRMVPEIIISPSRSFLNRSVMNPRWSEP